MADIESAIEDDEVEPAPQPTHGSFREIYNPLTRMAYVYQSGEWIPKTRQAAASGIDGTGEDVSSRPDNR